MNDVGGDSRNILIVEDNNLIFVLTGLDHVLSKGHHSRIVVRCFNLADANLQDIFVWSFHSNGTFVSHREDSLIFSTVLFEEGANISNDTRVDSTAHTLVRGDGDQEFFGIGG